MAVPFPALRPTRWELQLPGYPVISGSWRSTEYPEILGSIPEGAALRLSYENILDDDALGLVLLWRATAGGRFELDPLPVEVAAGIDDTALADRILNVAPLSWVVASEPRQDSVKAGRSSVEIELVSELRLVLSITPPGISCPSYAARTLVGCVGGAGGVGNAPGYDRADWLGGPPPPPPEGLLFQVEHNATNLATPSRSAVAVTNAGFMVGMPAWSTTQGLPFYWGYDPINNIATATPAYCKRFIETGWSQYRNVENQLVSNFCDNGAGVLSAYFMAFDGNLTSRSTITKQRLYRASINPSTGAVTSATAWDRTIGSTEWATLNSWSSSGGANINAIAIDPETGDTYIHTGVLRFNENGVNASLGTGYMTILKLSGEDNSQLWSVRITGSASVAYRIYIEDETILLVHGAGGGNGSALLRLSKATGSVVDGPIRYLMSGSYLQFTNSAMDPDGNIYLEAPPGTKDGGYLVLSVDSALNVRWAKYMPVAGDLASFVTASNGRAMAWATYLNHGIMVGTCQTTNPNGNANQRWGACSFDADGVITKSWRIDWNTFNSPSFVNYEPRVYGDNLIATANGQTTGCIPMSLSAEAIVPLYGTAGNAIVGEVTLGVSSDAPAVSKVSGHPGFTAINSDPGADFVEAATTLADQSESNATSLNTRLVY